MEVVITQFLHMCKEKCPKTVEDNDNRQ